MSSVITVGSNTYNLIPIPSSPGVSSIDLTQNDTVAIVQSPYTPSQVQTQVWPGADYWTLTFTTPKMNRQTAAPWRGFMAELRGVQNVFQFGDPFCSTPLGVAEGTPVCSTSGTNNSAFSTSLYTRGWIPNTYGQLLAGDYIQIGYRYHKVCEQVNSDSSGDAVISIWPSLREVSADGTALTLVNPVGLFRLAQNNRSWHSDFTQLVQMSFKCTEVR